MHALIKHSPLPFLLQSQFPEEVSLPIPPPLKAHMEDECFWILCRQKVLTLIPLFSFKSLLMFNAAVTVAKET